MRFDPTDTPRGGSASKVLFTIGALVASAVTGACDAGGIVTLTSGSTSGSGGGGGSEEPATSSASTSSVGGTTTAAGSTSASTGAGGADCGPGTTPCDGACVDVERDPANCGTCGEACGAEEVCAAGACTFACVGGSSQCGQLCVDLQNDPTNCGACGETCDAEQVCAEGECGFSCVGDSFECEGLCVDLQSDPGNCGACGETCDVEEVCAEGQCAFSCVGESVECEGLCVDLQNDPANCGGCGDGCGLGEVCSVGECGIECLGGTTLCGDRCEDLLSDRANCGVCGLACGFRAVCDDGLCSDGPLVVSTAPLDEAEGVARDRQVEAVFSEPMDPITINEGTFMVTDGATSIAGDVTYDGLTATFVPDFSYPASTVLTATITTGAEDLDGQGLSADYVWMFETGARVGQAPLELGAASPFAILAFNTVTNVAGTIVTGDLGISPGAALTGFPPGMVVGTQHLGNPTASAAQLALLAAYGDAVGRASPAALAGSLTGLTFNPGLYDNATSVMLPSGAVTLDAQGDVDAVFVFRTGTTLITGPGTEVVLAGGAKANNVFWAVGSSATLGTTSIFKGNILVAAAITANTGANVEGRLLAQGAAVTLDTNVISVPLP